MSIELLPSLGVTGWFGPLDFDHFRSAYLGQQPFSGSVPQTALADLAKALAEPSPRQLLDAHEGEVTAWFHGSDGRLRMPKVGPAAAKELFDAGITIYMRGLHELYEVSRQVALAFGLPRECVRTGLFCNTADARTRAHFDRVDTFCVQLRGTKTWWCAPNDFAPSPLTTWATLEPVPPELQLQVRGELPDDMPEGVETRLAPGSLLYVPRGTWHRTWSGEASCSLHIHVDPPLWVDVVLDAVRTRLTRHPEWRASAYEAGSAITDEASAHGIVDSFLRELVSVTSTIEPRDVLVPRPASAEPGSASFVKEPGTSFAVVEKTRDSARIQVTVRRLPWSPTSLIDVPTALLPMCWWVQSQGEGRMFTATDLVSACTGTEEEARELLVSLAAVSLIRPSSR